MDGFARQVSWYARRSGTLGLYGYQRAAIKTDVGTVSISDGAWVAVPPIRRFEVVSWPGLIQTDVQYLSVKRIYLQQSPNREPPQRQIALAFKHKFVFLSVTESASWPDGNHSPAHTRVNRQLTGRGSRIA